MNLADNLIVKKESMPHKICLIEKDTKLNYFDLFKKVVEFSEYLKQLDIKKGSKVLVLVPMSIDLYITLLSLWAIGAIPCFMDAGFIKNGMKNNDFDDIEAIIGISKYLLYSKINKNLKKLGKKINVKEIKKADEHFNFYDITNEYKFEELSDDFPAIYTYTSGTTGRPKIACRSHKFLADQADILSKTISYEENDLELSTIPIFTLSNINFGITTVIADANFSNLGKSDAKKLVNQITHRRINRLMASPGLIELINKYAIKHNIKLRSVKKIFTGGGAVVLDYIENLKTVFENASITTIYGSTEAEPIAILNIEDMTAAEIEQTKKGMGILAGKIVGVDDCKIIKYDKEEIGEISKDEFNNLQTSTEGEIVVCGKNVLPGYVDGYGDKENKFKVGKTIYHRTGDLGVIHNDKLWLRGRIKEPFFNIEAALHACIPDIGKTAIFKIDDLKVLVLEKKNKKYHNSKIKQLNEKNIDTLIKEIITFDKIDIIKYVSKIPVDKRHSTKVDYKTLRKMVKI